jgi:LmbE family N-acetylglucosaminyl deacetylase
MGHLGVPQENIHFLGLPDGQLRRHRAALHDALVARLRQIQPDHIWLPFRYDRHADHVALNHAVSAACREAAASAALYEYFVYYRWRLLPEGDVRRYLRPDDVWRVNIAAVAAHKRAALDMFKSQTTRFYPWQNRPNLKPQFLDEVSRTPEFFLRCTASQPGPAVFDRARTWIRVSHWLEPRIKKGKDYMVDLWWRGLRGPLE